MTMVAKSSLLLLGAALAFADQAPIGGSSECLRTGNPNECCLNGAPSDKVTIDDRTFLITCGSRYISLDSFGKPFTAKNALDCATHCAEDPSCEASSFNTRGNPNRGNCFFTLGDNMDHQDDGNWISFTEISTSSSCLESNDRNACCSDPTQQKGEVSIDNAKWKWTCGTMLRVNPTKIEAANAFECASRCASEGCEAVSFRILDENAKGNCFFVADNNNKDQRPVHKFMTLVKVEKDEDDDDITKPEPECEKCTKERDQCIDDNKICNDNLEQAQHDLDMCESNQADPEKLKQCELGRLESEKAAEECRLDSAKIEEKRKQCREDERACEKEKAELNNQKHQCENDRSRLNQDLKDKEDEITELKSQIKSLNEKINACNTSTPGGKCRTNLVEAGKR
ncbi:MAG: hypothetical protein LBE64_12565 [Acinetobacter pittii]|nr:hypothetical protein [Acinetobacter pittii]